MSYCKVWTAAGDGWQVYLTIDAVDSEAKERAESYIRNLFSPLAYWAREEFLELLKERTGDTY